MDESIINNVSEWMFVQIKSEFSLKANMTRLSLSYLVCIKRRQDIVGEAVIVEKVEGSRKKDMTGIYGPSFLKKT